MSIGQEKADEVEERLIEFAVRIIKLSSRLPRTAAGRHIACQILRSGTSPAPNYGEARSAESRADFAHKLGIVLKELSETLVWLKLILRSGLVKAELMADIVDENLQLSKIIISSLRTAKAATYPLTKIEYSQ